MTTSVSVAFYSFLSFLSFFFFFYSQIINNFRLISLKHHLLLGSIMVLLSKLWQTQSRTTKRKKKKKRKKIHPLSHVKQLDGLFEQSTPITADLFVTRMNCKRRLLVALPDFHNANVFCCIIF